MTSARSTVTPSPGLWPYALIRVYYLNTKIQKCNNQPYNTGMQEMAMTENIGIGTHNLTTAGRPTAITT